MKQIKDLDSARRKCEEAKKSSLKSELMQRLSDVFLKPTYKESTSTNTGSGNKDFRMDESLVNLESGDEGKNISRSGNAGIISLVLEQSSLVGKDKQLKKAITKKMMQAVWTDWFIIAFHSKVEGFGLYGRKKDCFIKIVGESIFPLQVAFADIRRFFKYDWINRRFRDTAIIWESDAAVICSD
jgi:hypothetical protein